MRDLTYENTSLNLSWDLKLHSETLVIRLNHVIMILLIGWELRDPSYNKITISLHIRFIYNSITNEISLLAMLLLLIAVNAALSHGYYTTSGNWEKGTNEDFIATNIGMKAEKIGLVSLTKDYSIVSVFIKLPNISDTIFPSKQEDISLIRSCSSGADAYGQISDRKRRFEHRFKEFSDNSKIRLDNYITSRRDILAPYVTPNKMSYNGSRGDRQKRSLLEAVGGPLINLALNAVSQYQIHKISRHLKQNENELLTIRNQLMRSNNHFQKVMKDVIGMSKLVVDDTTENLDRTICTTFLNEYMRAMDDKFHRFKLTIDEMLSGALSGKKLPDSNTHYYGT